MSEKSKTYRQVLFSAEVIEESSRLFDRLSNLDQAECMLLLSVSRGDVEWAYDNIEEFIADYRSSRPDSATFVKNDHKGSQLRLQFFGLNTLIQVSATDRDIIHKIFEVFDSKRDACKVIKEIKVETKKPTVFIGHGRNKIWRELKDHLQDKHGYQIEAYEVGVRAGHPVRDILQGMLEKSSFALLVMTAEDETADGKMRTRQNVVHEAGLFQGRLGFNKAIAIVEEGVEMFSNVESIEQIRFKSGNIKEVFGDVLATLNREFNTSLKVI